MTFQHGKSTYISLNAADLSSFTDTSELGRTADSHDVTTYGKNSHVKAGGLLDGKATMSGTYDNTAGTSPRAIIRPLIGQVATLVRRVEGTGVGKPQDTAAVLVTSYVETNPVADMVKWSCEMELSDDVTSTVQ